MPRSLHHRAIYYNQQGGVSPIEITYLIRDDFTTDDANPVASPRLSEPGAGRMIVDTDTGSHLSISGGNLVAGGSVAAANPRVHWENADGTSPAWAAGAIVTYKINSESSDFIGVENIAGGTPDIYYRWGAVNNINYAASAVAVTLPTLPAHALFVLDTSRVLFYSRSSAGVIKLHWVGVITPPATIVPTVSGGALSLTNVRLATIPAGNIAPQISVAAPAVNTGSIAPGTEDALTSGDFYMQVTITSEPSSGNNDFRFRVQDANNYWLRRITTTGAVELYEVVAGVATLRGSSAAAFAAGEKCTITADDETIRIFANTTLKVTYASAANFKTATGWTYAAIGTNGDEDNLEVWNRYAAGAYLTALDAVCL